MAEIVGEFPCGNCDDVVPLKKDNGGKFYYHCRCGQHFMRGRDGADVVLSKGTIFGAKPVNVTEKPQVDSVTEKPVTGPAPPPPKKKSVTETPIQQPSPGGDPEEEGSTFF